MAPKTAAKASPDASADDALDQVESDTTRAKPSSGAPAKRSLFDDDQSSSDEDGEEGGAQLGSGSAAATFKINEAYAKRFEYNKKREERVKLEEKYGPAKANGGGQDDEDDSDSSEDETEDEEGFLATEDLDAEISATLKALRSKDPKIYDKSATFYTPFEESSAAAPNKASKEKEKPVFLKDYHRERYMKGDVGADFEDDDETVPRTYAQEQADIKKSIVDEINSIAKKDEAEEEGESDGDEFIKRKPGQAAAATADGVHPSRAGRIPKVKITEQDVVNADKDPELFLSNFMASRAWAPPEGDPHWEAFESDDDDDEQRNIAEEFENAYNMRFEDPEKSNEVLKSYSRTMVADRTVRREEKKGRKRQRELEREKKEAEKQQRKEERAQLRKLKVEENEEKLKKIKQAAGLSGKSLKDEEWTKLLDDAWEDDQWEEEMKKKFGDKYYAEEETGLGGESSEDEEGGGASASSKKKKPKKPKWDDDIDIKDIVPDFDDSAVPAVTLSDEEEGEPGEAADSAGEDDEDEDEDEENPAKRRKTSKDHKKDRVAARRTARIERAKIEALVDRQMEIDNPEALAASASSSKKSAGAPAFRYRETSPNSFGLTARDILLAPSDAVLNEFAGLKKLATFRDPEKKRKDKKRLGKKARLREWRRDNFGREFEHTGPTFGFERDVAAEQEENAGFRHHKQKKNKSKGESEGQQQEDGEKKEKSRKRKRSKGQKAAAAE